MASVTLYSWRGMTGIPAGEFTAINSSVRVQSQVEVVGLVVLACSGGARHDPSSLSRRPLSCREIAGCLLGSASGFGQRSLASGAFVQDVQQLAGGCHGVAVGWGDAFPPVPGGVGCRKFEHRGEPG